MKKLLGNRLCGPAALAFLLAGCGGSDGDSGNAPAAPTAATLAVAADARTVDWNIPSTIDVTANDTASRGTVTLSAVTGAEHGSATVVDNKIVYTPAAGFYGVEKLAYTVSGEGGATARGEAVVTVEAVMTLNGNASDSPLAGASVTARVGERSFTAPANTSGDFSLALRSSAPTDFITLVASGVGPQAQVKLASLVGDVASLASHAATAQGQVGKTQVPALGVTHITTAFMALATRTLGGSAPATAQQLAEAAKKVDVDEVMYVATAIKLSADKGVALPAGVSDTMALAASDAATATVHAAAGTALADETRALVESEASAPVGSFSLGALAERTVIYRGFAVTYRANGTGRMSGRMGERDITWVADGPTVRLTYPTPVTIDYDPNTIKVNGVVSPYAFREISTGLVIQNVLNEATVKWGETGTVTYTGGPDTGKPVIGAAVTTTNKPENLSTAFNLDQRLPIPPAATAPGSMLAGVYANPQPTLETPLPGLVSVASIPQANDVLEFTSAADARFLLSGKAVSWSVSDNFLVIQDKTAGSVVWRMALLGGNSSGQQQWVAISDNIHVPFVAELADTPRLRFTDELVLRQWTASTYTALRGQPQGDRTISSTIYPSSTFTGTWEITATGELVVRYVRKSNASVAFTRSFVPVRWVGQKLSVLATGAFTNSFTTFEASN